MYLKALPLHILSFCFDHRSTWTVAQKHKYPCCRSSPEDQSTIANSALGTSEYTSVAARLLENCNVFNKHLVYRKTRVNYVIFMQARIVCIFRVIVGKSDIIIKTVRIGQKNQPNKTLVKNSEAWIASIMGPFSCMREGHLRLSWICWMQRKTRISVAIFQRNTAIYGSRWKKDKGINWKC